MMIESETLDRSNPAACNDHKIHRIKIINKYNFMHPAKLALITLILLWLAVQSAISSSVILSAPAGMDASREGICIINFTSSEDASAVFARLDLSDGFDYAGNCSFIMEGVAWPCQPSLRGRAVEWDLGDAIKSRKNVEINEWDQNPAGTDTGREWIELYNPTSQTVDLGGWKLVDSRSGKAMTIGSGTRIGPEGYFVLNWTQSSLINSDYTSIVLLDGAGREIDRTSAGKDSKNTDFCWARYPNGRDQNSDSDWRFQAATLGYSNGGISSDIYAGQSLSLQFNVTAGCLAPEEGRLSASISSAAGPIASSVASVVVRRANISLSVTPDRYDVAVGDAIFWTALLENQGDGAAWDAVINATLDGQHFQGANPSGQEGSWTVACLLPGKKEEIKFESKVASAQESYKSRFSASWGGSSATCEKVSQTIEQGLRTAIRKTPDAHRFLTVGETAGFAVSADLPGGAHDLWINDTIPAGLIYNVSSLSFSGLTLDREIRTADSDGSLQVCWHLQDSSSARKAEISYNCLLENSAENHDGVELPGTAACMSWLEGKGANGANEAGEGSGYTRKSDSDASGPITVVEPDLYMQMNSSRNFVRQGDSITFTLAVGHRGASRSSAYDLDLQLILPEQLAYQPGSARSETGAEFDEDALCWHLSVLPLDEMGDITDDLSESPAARAEEGHATFTFNATCRASPGQMPLAKARLTWTSRPNSCSEERTGQGGIDNYLREAAASVNAASLTIAGAADPDPVDVGEALTYTLTYEYHGNGSVYGVVICDDLDPDLALISADPAPNESGKWIVPSLDADGPHTITLLAHVNGDASDGELLQNCYSISCHELGDRPKSCLQTQVHNGSRLAVSKTALQKSVRRGEEADFLITVCNRGGQTARNITVRDVFASSVEVISVWPEMSGDGAWHFSALEPGACLQMGLTVRVPRVDVTYTSHQNVSGQGFVSTYRDCQTSRPSGTLSNQVFVTADGMALSASANVSILAETATSLSIREHGSGDYQCQEDLDYLTANKSISLNREVEANYQPVALALAGGRVQTVSCLWNERTVAKNGITNTSLAESYLYASNLKSESRFSLDENESKMSLDSSFQGRAETLAEKAQNGEFSSAEQYMGAFQLSEALHDAGSGMMANRTASGSGYVDRVSVSSDGCGRGQQIRESGTGQIRTEESIDTFTGFMVKELNASFSGFSLPVTGKTTLNLSQKWSEGIVTTTSHSLIAEEYSSATRLDMKTTAASPGERETESAFSGTAKLRTIFSYENNSSSNNGSPDVDLEESYQGDFLLKRRLILSEPALYDWPHLQLVKEGMLRDDAAAYTITLKNDGNVSLGPLYLQDLFPPGASFINSSLRPSQLYGNSSNWTLLHLAVGDTVRIDINLDVENCSGDIVNRASVLADCSLGTVTAENCSTIFIEPLSCCPVKQEASPGKQNSSGEKTEPAIGCACLGEAGEDITASSTGSDFLSSSLVRAEWDEADANGESEGDSTGDSKGGSGGSCPLNCPEIEQVHDSIQ